MEHVVHEHLLEDGGDSTDVTVLLVEDETSVLDTYEMYVRSAGYSVRTATSGGEALVKLDREVDVVLLDRRMPGMSGDDVLEHILNWNMDCRVIMVTAIDPDPAVLKMGFDDYLQKPIKSETLIETIEQQLLFDRYKKLLDRYQSVTKMYTTVESNLEGNKASEQLEELEAEREMLLDEISKTTESFSDEEITSIFTEIHD